MRSCVKLKHFCWKTPTQLYLDDNFTCTYELVSKIPFSSFQYPAPRALLRIIYGESREINTFPLSCGFSLILLKEIHNILYCFGHWPASRLWQHCEIQQSTRQTEDSQDETVQEGEAATESNHIWSCHSKRPRDKFLNISYLYVYYEI